ncbi:MAG: CHRD domain-containing protein [Acidobacteria bacterium]|nr:CHRD domain-containing protein [Acidobacteriota bacterium]
MRKIRNSLAVLTLIVGATASAVAHDDTFRARLSGSEEVPAVSTGARGRAALEIDGDTIAFDVSYENLEGDVSVAHIHLGQRGVSGSVIAFFCGGGGKPACPPAPARITGTIVAADVIGPTAQGIAPGEFEEAVRALRAGLVYANVHSSTFPSGEIRGQLRED